MITAAICDQYGRMLVSAFDPPLGQRGQEHHASGPHVGQRRKQSSMVLRSDIGNRLQLLSSWVPWSGSNDTDLCVKCEIETSQASRNKCRDGNWHGADDRVIEQGERDF